MTFKKLCIYDLSHFWFLNMHMAHFEINETWEETTFNQRKFYMFSGRLDPHWLVLWSLFLPLCWGLLPLTLHSILQSSFLSPDSTTGLHFGHNELLRPQLPTLLVIFQNHAFTWMGIPKLASDHKLEFGNLRSDLWTQFDLMGPSLSFPQQNPVGN